jgi:hypothetical protein
VVAAVLLLSLYCALGASASTERASADTSVAAHGSGAGQVLEPAGLAVDNSNGTLVVADRGNRRVDVFDAAGSFIRAFGWGVVASGPGNHPRNEVEKVTVAASGGKFALLFVQNSAEPIGLIKEETASIPFNATAATVQAALEGLAPLGPGDVAVSGPSGGPWTIEFTGASADTDVHELEAGQATQLTGGEGKLQIQTTQSGANYEACEASAGDVCRAGQRGVQAGQLSPSSIAVDPASHDVYVFDGLETSSTNEASTNRVQKFTAGGEFLYALGGGVDVDSGADLCTGASGDTCGAGAKGAGAGEFDAARSAVAVGPGGILYVNDGERVQKFSPSGASLGQVALPGAAPDRLAVNSAGDIYAVVESEVRKYSPSGTQLDSIPLSNVNALAVDAAADLYTSDLSSGNFGISRFDSAGALELVFYSLTGKPAGALAAYPAPGGDVFTLEEGEVRLLSFPAPGPVVYPLPASVFAAPIGNVKATVHSEINPEGKATTFHYQYVDQAAFEAEGWTGPAVEESAESAPIGADFTLHSATAQLTGLTPETVYHFRVVASNADAPAGIVGPEGTFETEPPLAFGSLWSTKVKSDSVVLHGQVNPLGIAATGYFEYVDDAAFQVSGFDTASRTPAGSSLDFGKAEELVERSASASALAPGTTYHYRLVASDHCKPAEPAVVCTFEGPPATFRTFAAEAPPSNCPANAAFRLGPGAFLSDCRGYEMVSPVDKNGVNVEVVFNVSGYPAGLDQSALDGGKLTYSAYRSFGQPQGAPYTSQYIAERGAAGWSSEAIAPPREGPTLFTTDGLDYQFKAFTDDLCLGWPLQDTALPLAAGAVPDYPNLYRRDNCQPGAGSYDAITTVAPEGELEPRLFFPELQGFSADGGRAFFSVPAKLTAEAVEGVDQVYEASGGSLRPVCVLPDETVSASGCSLGTGSGFGVERNATLAGAVSRDGTVAYWSSSPTGEAKLYVRVGGQETFLVSGLAAQFWTAAGDGSTAIYTAGDKLFEFSLASKGSTLIAEGVRGVAGASADASVVYFASTKALDAGATAGQLNLYRHAAGSIRFVGTLAAADALSGKPSPIAARPLLHTARVTPDGSRLVLMSKARLTGYDNSDAVSGEPDAEVFLYDSSGDGKLLCVSCNPGGGRPSGSEWGISAVTAGWAAAWIPAAENQLYAPRIVADDGSRVFFNSFDALVSRDSNSRQDVYEWEAPGTGDCATGGPGFVAAAGGCVALVSSGQSSQDSGVVDSSTTGADVFFKTASSLVSQDPGLVDIYDARVGGGFPPPPAAPLACEGEACQQPGPEPGHPTPSSAAFVGPGNVVPRPKSRCSKGRHKLRKHGKTRCVKNGKHGKRARGQHGSPGAGR